MLTLSYSRHGGAVDNWALFNRSVSMNPVIKSTVMAGAAAAALLCQGCAVVAVADAAVTKVTGAVAGAAINVVTPD